MEDKNNAPLKSVLRQKAEEILQKRAIVAIENYSDVEILKLIHELEIHQIELEVQNDALNLITNKAEIEAEKYTNLYDFAPCGYFTITKQDEILELNFSGATLLGKERSQLLNKRFAYFIADKSKPTFFEFLEKIFASKTTQTCEIVLSGSSKIATHVFLTGIIKGDGDQCLLTMVDISPLKDSEKALHQSKLLLQTTIESQKDTIILSIDKNYNYLSFNKAHSDGMKQSYNTDVKVGMNLLDCISSIEDRKVAKENYDRALNGESHTNIRIYGVGEKATYESFFNPIVDEDNNIIGATALSRNITNRIQNENNLKISEENLQSIFNSVADAIYVLDQSGIFIDVNKGAEEMYLYSRPELIGKSYKVVAAPDLNDFDEVHEISKSVFETGTPCTFEFWAVRKNGEIFQKEIIVNRGKYLGETVIIASARDITVRKNTEKLLIQSKTRFSSIINSSPVAMVLNDENFNITYLNKAFYDMFGYTLEEIPTVLEWFPKAFPKPEYRKKISNAWITALDTAKQTGEDCPPIEVIIRCKNGSNKTVMVSATKLLNSYDNEYLVNLYDITAQKQAEQALIQEKRRLALILIGTGAGTWEWNIDTGILIINERWAELIGYTIEELAPLSFETWQKYMHPDDLKVTQEIIEKYFQGNLDFFESEFRMKHKNGDWIWILSRGKINKRDFNGEPLLMSGTHLDITERKHSEEKLKLTSEKFQELVNSTGGIVWEADAHTYNFTFVSEQAVRLLGYAVEEWHADGFWANHLHPEDKQNVIDYCVSHTEKMEAHDFTYRFIAKNGETVWLRDIVNIVAEDGKPRWLRGVMFDVTQLKEANLLLGESEEKYRGLVENAPYGIIIYVADKIAFINDEGIRMLGAKNKAEIIGTSVFQFVPPDNVANIAQRMIEVVRDDSASAIIEEQFVRFDGIPFDAELKAIPTIYGHQPAVQIIFQDVTQKKQSALELNKINRVYALISQINNLIIRVHNREELFQEICNIAVNFGKFRLSWIGLLKEDNEITTAAFAGFEEGYAKSISSSLSDKYEETGPTRLAIREGRTVICNDIENDQLMKPWRKDALERGYSSLIAIPLIVRNEKIGSFNLYSDQKNFFSSEEEISLLEKITLNIAFALESILIEEERKQADEKIRQLSQAVEQSPATILITDINGNIDYVNPRFIETTGYTLEEVLGENPRFLKSGHTTAEEYKKLWKTISGGQTWQGEFYNKKKDGSLFWESCSISPLLNDQGITTHYIAINENITDRKIAEQELIDAKLKAEESDRLKLAFLANMSHEIRTPMNGILGFTELLKAPDLSAAEQNEFISIIEKSGQRMLNIINDIINISKVEAGQVEVTLSETNVNDQLNYIYSFFTPEANQKGIKLVIKKQLPEKYNLLLADNEKLYAVLTNLVKNAIKFTNEGSIEFGCEKKGTDIAFFVKDSGIGISDSQKGIVFERFRQASESVSRSHEGSGLGLAISKAYIEKLGGKIWVDSEKDKGSTFHFTIPSQSELENEPENNSKENSQPTKENLGMQNENKIKNLKVLIVEDDPISKLLLTFVIKSFSKEIIKVSSGIEAIEACVNHPDIDLVMMDANMPKMGGYEATRLIREFNKDVVIIAQTANALQSDRKDAIDAGCTDYITKPINSAELTAMIQKYFSK